METYDVLHEIGEYCTSSTCTNHPGVAGSAGSPGAAFDQSVPVPSETDNLKPPYTIRGAKITTPLENRTLIDWVAVTLKTNFPEEVITIIGLEPTNFIELPRGRYGYRKSLCFGNISILFDGQENMGCHLVMSGEGCRIFEGHFDESPWLDLFTNLLELKANFTRLDIATDNIDGQLCFIKLKQAIINREIRTRFKKAGEQKEYDLTRDTETANEGHTIRFGSRQSLVFIRFYDKAAQLSLHDLWNRAEIELKKERAQKAVEHLVAGLPIGRLFSSIVNTYLTIISVDDTNISRCPLQPWWEQWLTTTEKIRLTTAKALKSIDEIMAHLLKQSAPSLAMIEQHLGQTKFNLFIQQLILNGNKRMRPKHRQILAISACDEENDMAEVTEFAELAAILEFEGGLSKQEAERVAREQLCNWRQGEL